MMIAGALLIPTVTVGQTPNEVDWTDPDFEIERNNWQGEIAEDQTLVVSNNFGNVLCRFGGAEGQAEIAATIQHFPSEGPRLEVVVQTTEKMIHATVAFREQPDGPLSFEGTPGQLKRADLVVFVPEGRNLEVLTRDGTIECKGIRGDVTATTTSGPVRIKGTSGRVVATTDSGSVTVLFSPHGSKRIQRVHTVSGKIEVHIPENADIEVKVATHGEIHSDFEMDLTAGAADDAPKRGVVVIASTGSELELTSDTGSIGIVRRLATQ